MKNKRNLAVDLGTKRIGLALSDELNLGFPHTDSILVKGSLEHSAKLVIDWYAEYTKEPKIVETILVGNPLALDGSLTKRSEISKNFCQKLEIELKARALDESTLVVLWDERLTSVESEILILEGSHKKVKGERRRELKDQLSATLILSSYMSNGRKK